MRPSHGHKLGIGALIGVDVICDWLLPHTSSYGFLSINYCIPSVAIIQISKEQLKSIERHMK